MPPVPRGRVVHFLGTPSVQRGTFEDNLVELARTCAERASAVAYVYPGEPAVPEFAAAVEAAGGEVLVEPATGTADLAGALAVRRTIRSLRPSVVHAHFGRQGLLAAAGARILGVPRVFLTKHHESWPALSFAHAAALRAVAPLTDKILCVSDSVLVESLAAGVAPSRLAVVTFGVDTDRYRPDPAQRASVRHELGLGRDGPLALCVSHLRQPKGVDVLIEAWSVVCDSFPDALLVVAGDGEDRGSLTRQAACAHGGERIRFLGIRQDVPRLLAACDLFVCPSLSEGGGLNVIEALSAGAPVVSTRVGLMRGRVDESSFVSVPRAGDPRGLADAIAAVLSRPDLAAALRARGRSHAAERFAIRSSAAAIADLYFGGSGVPAAEGEVA